MSGLQLTVTVTALREWNKRYSETPKKGMDDVQTNTTDSTPPGYPSRADIQSNSGQWVPGIHPPSTIHPLPPPFVCLGAFSLLGQTCLFSLSFFFFFFFPLSLPSFFVFPLGFVLQIVCLFLPPRERYQKEAGVPFSPSLPPSPAFSSHSANLTTASLF